MADNTNLPTSDGLGDSIATDDIGGVKYPRSKIVIGADGTNDGDVSSANPLPITGTVDLGATDNAVLDSIASALGGTITVDGSGVTQPVSGTVTANLSATDNAVIDAIQAACEAVQTAVEGTLTVGSHAVTNAGTFAVQAAQSGTWSIANISGTVSLPTGASTAAKQPALGTAGTAASDVITVQGIASMTAIVVDGSGVTQPVSAASLPLPSGASTAANQSTANSSLADIKTAVEILDNAISGTEMQVDVIAALPAGTNAIGKLAANSGVDIGDVDVTSVQAATSGGCDIFRSIDLDESEEEVKSSAGQLYGCVCINLSSAVRYLKFYNASAASVTVGTTTPVLTIPIPTAGSANGAGFVVPIPAQGIAFSTGICVAATTGIADSDTGAPSANEVVVNLFYK